MKTENSKTDALRALRALARDETHGGYTWAAVMADGELLCVPCVRGNYRQIFRATSDPHDHSGWRVEGMTHSGDMEESEHCANCGEPINADCGERMRCGSCKMVSINGVPCHETGCENSDKEWDAVNGEWVRKYSCVECGAEYDSEEGAAACCAPQDWADNEDLVTATAPSAWASYLMNGDDSGLDAEEKAACDAWVESVGYGAPVDCRDAGFTHHHDAREFLPLGADCQEYAFLRSEGSE